MWKGINSLRWESDPLMTLFMDGCIQKDLDMSEGGAQYCDYGILSVGLGNAIDSLLNIKTLVFVEEKETLLELKNAVLNNYKGEEKLQSELKRRMYWGTDSLEVMQLVQVLTDEVSKICSSIEILLGER